MIKLTQYSHGAGCGCKIAPDVLHKILAGNLAMPDKSKLLVGNHSKDDAAVYQINEYQALISTTDFFMPIVDDPYEFGRIAGANAISDVYAMGGKPILAIAILGWPINLISPDIAAKVIDGARSICIEADIALAGGHSIDAPEPIFGLAVNGLLGVNHIKQNNQAKPGDLLYLTKPIGIGILTTAEKKSILKSEHIGLAAKQMMQLNKVGESLGQVQGVHAMTDVTGFGLLGHLHELCEGSKVSAEISVEKVPLILPDLYHYLQAKAIPGGTLRNLNAYGHNIDKGKYGEDTLHILADPQTSGGLLISADEGTRSEVEKLLSEAGLGDFIEPIGRVLNMADMAIKLV